MKVSIITSCYNREATIRDAIRSVMAQDYPDIEYIIVDGASTDRSVEIIRSEAGLNPHKEDVVFNSSGNENVKSETPYHAWNAASPLGGIEGGFISEPDSGMYEALNKGIRMATGDVIALLHSDDVFYDSHTVSAMMERMEQTQCDFLYADGLFVDAENTGRVVRNWIGGRYSKWKVRHGWLPLHPTCYIRREVMEKLGLYDESYRIAADTDLLVRYLLENDLHVEYLERYVVRMRMGGLSTDNSRRAKMWKEDIRVYSSHGFRHVKLTKIEKMMWKVPQFIKALFA